PVCPEGTDLAPPESARRCYTARPTVHGRAGLPVWFGLAAPGWPLPPQPPWHVSRGGVLVSSELARSRRTAPRGEAHARQRMKRNSVLPRADNCACRWKRAGLSHNGPRKGAPLLL